MDKNLTIIEIRIKFLRDLKGLSQLELAKNIGVSRSVINSWENGYANISLRKLVKLSYFFKVPIYYILGLINDFNKDDYDFKENIDLKYLGRNIRIIRVIEGLSLNLVVLATTRVGKCQFLPLTLKTFAILLVLALIGALVIL